MNSPRLLPTRNETDPYGCSIPQGWPDNSPALQRWASTSPMSEPRRGERTSIEHVILERDLVSLKKCHEFFSERAGAMVFLLSSDVSDCVINTGNSDAEGAVSFLPRETKQFWESFVNPFRTISLHELHCLRDRKGRRQRQKNMEMIGYATGCKSTHLVFAGDPSEIRPESFADVRCKPRFASVGGKDAMEETMGERMHSWKWSVLSSLRDSYNFTREKPSVETAGLLSWRPCGTRESRSAALMPKAQCRTCRAHSISRSNVAE